MIGPEIEIDSGSHLRRRAPGDAPQAPGRRRIDVEKVVQVALNPDDELRNLQVALLYSLSSARMDEHLRGDAHREVQVPVNANWFTVAQWAVLTVGRNMRTRDVPHRASLLPGALRRRLTPAVLSLRSADDRRVAAALSYGQVMVFVSVYHALLHSPFADVPWPEPERYGDDGPAPSDVVGPPDEDDKAGPELDTEAVNRVVHAIQAADEERRRAEEAADLAQRQAVLDLAALFRVDLRAAAAFDRPEHRAQFYGAVLDALAERAGYTDDLTHAFDLYAQATPEGQKHAVACGELPRSPADLIFEANLRIAAVEQVILDEAVTMVVDHVPRHLLAELEGRVATFAERSLRVPRRIAQINASRRLSGMSAAATEVWARVMTDQVMVVALPAETIRLGRDIPRRSWNKPFYAEDLERLSPSAAALFDLFDRSLGDGRGAGAGDWRRFDDRMNFVANLLRSRQQDPSLFWQPFTDEDVARVWNGTYPNRIADPFEQAIRSPSFPVDPERGDPDTESCDEFGFRTDSAQLAHKPKGPWR